MPTTVKVKNKLPAIATTLKSNADRIQTTTAAQIAKLARERAPRRTGLLRLSTSSAKNIASSKVFYARYQEFGTRHMRAQPFLRPALIEEARILKTELPKMLLQGVK